jgi:hypothetical protein
MPPKTILIARKLALTPAFVLAGLAGAAAAQQSMPTVGPSGGGERRIHTSVHVRALYDSAVSRGTLAGGPPGAIRRADVLYSPGVDADIVLPVGRLYTYLQGSAGYEFYQRQSKFNRERLDLRGGGGAQVGPCTAGVALGWSRGRTQTEDLTLGVRNNVQESRTAALQTQCMPLAGIVTTLVVDYSDTNNSAVNGVVDSNTTGVNGSIGYGNRRLGTLSVVGQYQTTNYERDNSLPSIMSADGIDVWNVGLQYQREVGNRLVGRIGVGYGRVKTQAGSARDNSTMTADVGLTYAVSSRLHAGLSYSRNASSTIIEGIDYILNDQAQVSLNYSLTPRISTNAALGWTKRRYQGEVDPRLLGTPRNEEIVRVSTGVSVRVGRRSTLSLDAQYQDRNTDVPTLSFDSVRVGVTAATSF